MSTQFTNRQWRLPNNENKDKQSNYSMDFDGSSQYIDTTLDIAYNSDFSVSFWFNWNQDQKLIITDGSFDAWSTIGFGFQITSSGEIKLLVGDNGSSAGQTLSTSAGSISANNWYHIVGVCDLNNEIRLYLNGTSAASTSVGSSRNETTNNIRIGGDYSSTKRLINGKIDGVAIFDYALTDGTGGTVNQIAALYGSSSTGIGNPMSLSPKPVAYYPLGDQDAFNGSNYLVPNSSLKDYVFEFNVPSGGIDRITLNQGITLTGNKTFSAWINLTTAQNSGGFLFFGEASTNYYLFIQGDYIYIRDSSGLSFAQYTPGFSLNTWYHICISGNGTNLIPYVNGSPISGTYVDREIQSENTIGSFSNGSFPYRGEMSNIQIWDTNLSGPEVTTLYNYGSPIQTLSNIPQNSNLQGWWKLDASATYDSSTTTWTIPDDSSNSNDGTSSGMTQANLVQSDLSFTSGYSPYALDFDSASSDYIDLGNLTGVETNQFSISMWAKVTATNRILFNSGLAHPDGMLIQYVGTYFFISVGGSSAASTTITLNTTKWYNILLSVNGTTLKLYIDGSQLGSDLTIGSGRTGIGSDAVLARYKYSTSYYVKGSISNASIWNTALTSSQVTELYNEGVPSNLNNHSAYSNLVNWWQLGSNSSFNSTLNQWTCIDEKGTNTGESSQTFNEDAIVDGVGSYANGLSSGMGGDEVIGDAPYSTANSLSVNMDVEDRTTDTPS